LRATLGRAARAAAVIVPAVVATNLYQLLPYVHGIRASWMSSGSLFHLEDFTARSLDAFPSLVGFGREIGYLAFTGRQTWYSHPWLPFASYVALALIPVAAAWATLAWRRDTRTLYLLACAVSAAFLAKGLHGPVGGPYRLAAE